MGKECAGNDTEGFLIGAVHYPIVTGEVATAPDPLLDHDALLLLALDSTRQPCAPSDIYLSSHRDSSAIIPLCAGAIDCRGESRFWRNTS
jgi:hypothetical protein